MATSASAYTPGFFDAWATGSSRSAAAVLDIVLDRFPVTSAIDVGCGAGTWTRVLHQRVPDVVAVDGDWVPADARPPGFLIRDLEQPLRLPRTFDLVISMEVAEHLSAATAERFVADLCRLAPVVLFSAAIPAQGGTRHINERWQSYWADLFARHGMWPHDLVRPLLWDDAQVEPWYVQNTLVYTRERPARPPNLDLVHPRVYLNTLWERSRRRQLQRRLYPALRPVIRTLRGRPR